MKTVISIIILFCLVKLINLISIPIFGDEALYLYLADDVFKNSHNLFNSINYGVMPLYIWFLGVFDFINNGIINPLFLGRFIAVLIDGSSALFLYLALKRLFNKFIAVSSVIIYLSLPLTFFNSRFVLLDTPTNFLVLFAFYISVKLIHSSEFIQFKNIILTSIVLSLSYFVKPIALISFAPIFLLPIINFGKFSKTNIKTNKNRLFSLALIFILTIILIAVFYIPIEKEFSSRFVQESTSLSQTFINTKKNFHKFNFWAGVYFNNFILILAIICSILGILKFNLKIILVTFWVISAMAISFVISANYFPRHLYLISVPIIILTSILIDFIRRRSIITAFLIFCIILIPYWIFDYKIIFSPQNAPIAMEDKQQFFENWSSGEGLGIIADYLKENPNSITFVEDDPSQYWVLENIYGVNKSNIVISQNILKDQFIEDELLNNYSEINKKFVILNKNFTPNPKWPLVKIMGIKKGPNREVALFKIVN